MHKQTPVYPHEKLFHIEEVWKIWKDSYINLHSSDGALALSNMLCKLVTVSICEFLRGVCSSDCVFVSLCRWLDFAYKNKIRNIKFHEVNMFSNVGFCFQQML